MCAAILKNWREAATLILVHSRKRLQQTATKELYPSNVIATDTLQQTTGPSEEELEVLVLKRSSKSSFMPDLYVFPGGIADNTDFTRNWLSLFGVQTPDEAQEKFSFCKTVTQHAPMFHRKRDPDFTHIPSEVAFRISAIRETFEESGVLLARSIDQTSYQHNPRPTTAYSFGNDHSDSSMLEEWRQRVTRDPSEFLTLCKSLDIVPDIWSLYDWSNWLTPLGSGDTSGKRFDAAFFICCLQDCPYVAEDAGEMVHAQWSAPLQMVTDYSNRKVQLAPPQIYETCRLINFNSMDELLQFLQSRVGQPLERWLPVRMHCADGVIFVFPGDSLYPEQPDVEGEQPVPVLNETLQELLDQSASVHRAVAGLPEDKKPGSPLQFQLQCNIPHLPHGQLPPAAV